MNAIDGNEDLLDAILDEIEQILDGYSHEALRDAASVATARTSREPWFAQMVEEYVLTRAATT